MEDLETFKNNEKTTFIASHYEDLQKKAHELEVLAEEDSSMKELAHEEIADIKKQQETIWKQMEEIVTVESQEEEFPNEIVLEVRAGAGGEEAALFAEELALMYQAYGASRGWSFQILGESRAPMGGYKEASFEIKGKGVYEDMRFETGVHRIQRIPRTEKMGRIHTSTASVAILPIRKKSIIELEPTDLRIEFSRSGGKGGQNVNKVETAVRVVHIPTGMDVRCTSERSQAKNKEKALSVLRAKIEALKEEQDAKKYSAERAGQIGSGDRSEKIRTYNVLQDRITDHRIKESWHNLEGILGGNISEIIETLKKASKEKTEA